MGAILPKRRGFAVPIGARLQDSLVLVHGGMAQNVGPILEMVTEKYLLRSAAELDSALELVRGEAKAAFGDFVVFLDVIGDTAATAAADRKPWATLSDCRYVAHPNNDGDSFRILEPAGQLGGVRVRPRSDVLRAPAGRRPHVGELQRPVHLHHACNYRPKYVG